MIACVGLSVWGLSDYLFSDGHAVRDFGASAWFSAALIMALLVTMSVSTFYRLANPNSEAAKVQTATTAVFVGLVLLTFVSLGVYLFFGAVMAVILWFVSRRRQPGLIW